MNECCLVLTVPFSLLLLRQLLSLLLSFGCGGGDDAEDHDDDFVAT